MIKQLMQFALLIFISVFLWFVGPLVAIAGKVWLASPLVRLSLILLIVLIWGSYYFFQQLPKVKIKTFKPPKKEDDFDESWKVLNKHFTDLVNHIQSKFKFYRWQRLTYKIPIHLMIGTPNCGKSSLIENSNYKFITVPTQSKLLLAHENPGKTSSLEHNEGVNPQENFEFCYWHLYDKDVLLDTPGSYATSTIDNKITSWHKLLSLLTKKKYHFPVKNIILVINLSEMAMQRSETFNLNIHSLKQRLLDIRKVFNRALPLYIVFSKCDLILGFREFFDNLTETERNSSLSINLDPKNQSQNLSDQFKKAYLNLLQKINNQVISRLHQEHNLDKRNAIQVFPAQMEQLKDKLFQVIYHLAEKTNYSDTAYPMTIYFISSIQSGEPINLFSPIFKKNFNIDTVKLNPSQPLISRNYFTQPIFNFLLKNKSRINSIVHRQYLWQRRSLMLSAFIIIAVFSTFTSINFKNDLLQVSTMQETLYNYQSLVNSADVTAAMDARVNILNNYNNAVHFWWFNPLFSLGKPVTIKKLTHQTNYFQDFTAQLTQALTIQMQNSNSSPDILYNDLKVYLMLAEPKHLRINFLIHWLQHQSAFNDFIGTTDARLQLTNALSLNLQPINPNLPLIASVRNNLNSLPKQYLAHLILESMTVYKQPPLQVNLGQQHFSIPFLYTQKGLQTLFLNDYPKAVAQAIHGNWILGINKNTNSSVISDITTQFIELYANDYATWWKTKLARIQFKQANDIVGINNTLNSLLDASVGMTQFIQIIQQNTDINNILPPAVNNSVITLLRSNLSAHLGQEFATYASINSLQLQDALQQLASLTQAMLVSGDVRAASFNIAREQFTNPNQQNIISGFTSFVSNLPQPFGSWFVHLGQILWQQVIINTQEYINIAWQNDVVSAYQNNLNGQYPLFQNATTDADLAAFTAFFSPSGIIESFFNNYLQSFVNQQQSQWQWNEINGQSLGFSPAVLDLFERARIITTMFFPDNSNMMNVHFSLQPIAMMPIVKNFQLKINGQSLLDEQGSKNISSFIWPGNSSNLQSQIIFNEINGQQDISQQQGPWSWFRLLDQAQIKTTPQPNQFIITFNVDGTAVKYKLVAENIINPFIPGIINQFRIPQSLN